MGEGSYYNFDLIIERAGEKYRARVFDSPAGQASAEFEVPFSELELENFVLRMGRPRTGVRRVDSSEMEAVKQCGERLFRAVFADDVYASFLRSRDCALEEGKGLRVRLRIDVPEFHDYPWEYLYNAHLNQFLALSRDTPVVRYLELPYPVQPLTVQPPLKILVMISSPEGFPKLNVEEEWKRLSNALAPLFRRGLVTLERLKKPTLIALQQQLRRGEFHIFHFIGHGKFSEYKQDGLLLLEEENGSGRPVSGEYLGTVLHDHRSLRLVVLNACEGARTSQEDPYAGVAQTLVLQGIPAVIAMQFEILESAAITFAQEFYGAVADGFPVDAAVSEARKAIFAAGNDVEWGTPVLYMRTPQGVIFEIPEAQRVRQPVADEPIPFIDTELEQKLEGLYTEGLAAFWVEDWDKACDRFQRILADRPDHAAAADKLAESKRQRNLARLYARASEAQSTGDWPVALKTLEELLKDSPEYKDASSTLKIVKKQKQLAELYAEAKKLHTAHKWQAVAKVFTQIKSIDPEYPDPENLLPTTEKELAELKRQAELNELYSRAVHAMDAGQWEEAQRLLRQIQEKEPGFLESERLLSKVEVEIQHFKEEQKRRDQINTFYEQALGLLRSKKWRKALDKIEEIRKLDEQFEDSEKIAERAQMELAHEEQEAEHQNELAAMYAEAVRLLREERYQEALEKWQEIKGIDPKYPDRQMVQWTARKNLAALAKPKPKKVRISIPKPLWLGLGGIVTMGVIILALVLSENPVEEPSSPTTTVPISGSGGNIIVPTATQAPVEFTVTPLDETCPIYPQKTDHEGFVSESRNPLSPWSGTSVHFMGTDECTGREMNGAASLIYRYRLEFEAVTPLTSVAVSGAAFNGPDSLLRVLDENMHVLGTVGTSGGNTLQTHIITLEGVDGRVFFVDEFDTSSSWRFRQSIVVNGSITAPQSANGPAATETPGDDGDPTMYDDFDKTAYDGGYNKSFWTLDTNSTNFLIGQSDGNLSIKVYDQAGIGLYTTRSLSISEPTFFEARLYLDPQTTDNASHLYIMIENNRGYSNCGIFRTGDYAQQITCWSEYYGKKVEADLGLDGILPGWHMLRFEIEPETMIISYVIDGLVIDSFNPKVAFPSNFREFKQSQFNISIALNNFGPSKEPVGYIDYVRMGAIEDDPNVLVYDNFDNTSFTGSFNSKLWQIAYDGGEISQEDGNLMFYIVDEKNIEWLYAGLIANDYSNYKFTHPIYFEARMSVDTVDEGGIFMQLQSVDNSHIYGCGIERLTDFHVKCVQSEHDGVIEDIFSTRYEKSNWHTFRLTLEPDENRIHYYMDGNLVGSFISKYPDTFTNTLYQFYIQGFVHEAGKSTGLVDYVHIGEWTPLK